MPRFFLATAVWMSVALGLLPGATLAQTVSSGFNAGDLIKGSTSAVYYFAPNGRRYAFPNAKIYFTWYPDFQNVKTVSDRALAVLPLGGAVTYRPGVKMIKLTTDPKVYAVERGGILRHVVSEQLAETLYGLSWKNRIDDLPDEFFAHYRVGPAVQTSADYQPDEAMTQTSTIALDKGMETTTATISIGDITTGFVPTTLTVKRGTQITWVNRDILIHRLLGNGWDSGQLAPGESYSRTFSTSGSFEYSESAQSAIRGIVDVMQ